MPGIRPVLAAFALGLALLAAPAAGSAAALEDITAANKAGKTVFLVVTDAAAKNLDAARNVAHQAMQKTPNSVVLELNRSDPKQAAAVKGYRCVLVMPEDMSTSRRQILRHTKRAVPGWPARMSSTSCPSFSGD